MFMLQNIFDFLLFLIVVLFVVYICVRANKNKTSFIFVLDFHSSFLSCSYLNLVTQRARLFGKHANSTGSVKHLQHSISQTLTSRFSPKEVSLSPEASKNLSHSSESEYSFSMSTMSQFPLTAQQDYLINELKFINDEVANVRSELNDQVSKCLSNCLRDLVWNALLISETVLEDDSLTKKVKKKTSNQSFEASSLLTCINEWKTENRMDVIPDISISVGPLLLS